MSYGEPPRFRVGDVIEFGGQRWTVTQVTNCATRCKPVSKKKVTIRERTFQVPGKEVYISNHAEVPIVKLARKGRRHRTP